MDFETIPQELKKTAKWCLWRYEQRKGKRTKVPYNPYTGKYGASDNPASFADFYTAEAEFKRGKYDGMGIGIFGNLGAVDIDHCLKDGVLSDMAHDIVNTMESYTEISPSGEGIRIIFKAPNFSYNKERYYIKHPKNGLEVYISGCTNKYVTITGDALCQDKPVADCSVEIGLLLESYMKRKSRKAVDPSPPVPVSVNTSDCLKRGIEKDGKLRELWNGSRPTADESSNDLALMNKLAYWCNRDEDAMISAFLSSPFVSTKDDEHKKKAQRKDYLKRTAERAIQDCSNTAYEDHEEFQMKRHHENNSSLPSSSEEQDVFGRVENQQKITAPRLSVISARELQDKDLPPLRFLVENLLPPGLVILAAPPKFGKSWWVLDLCLSLASGNQFLGHRTEKSGCLYLALEDSERRLQDRMNKILHGERAPENFDYATKAPDLGNGLITQLSDYLKQHVNTRLIVIDTFQKVRPPNTGKDTAYSTDYKDAGALKEFADKHNLCILIVHHLRKMKDDTDVFNQISGTNGISGAADTSIVLSRKKRTDEQTTLSITGRDVENSDDVMRFNKEDYKWEMLGSVDWLEEQRARLAYRQNPIVKTIKTLLNQSSPEGWKGTAKQLLDAGTVIAGTYLSENPRRLSSLISALEKPLFEYDGIVHEKNKNGSGGGSHRFFFSSSFVPSATVEQLSVNDTVGTVDEHYSEAKPL